MIFSILKPRVTPFLLGYIAFAYLLFSPLNLQAAEAVSVKWTSKDTSLTTVTLGPNATFSWKNPKKNGMDINLTGGSTGATFSMSDSKDKSGGVSLDPTSILPLFNPNYGKAGEAPIPINGQITQGTGSFELSLIGFNEIADITTTFHATLVSDGTDNPINLSVFGQGDQLSYPTPGSISYISKWTSPDVITLSNGAELAIGDFFLLGDNSFLPNPSIASFTYGALTTPDGIGFTSTFTTGEKYVFTDDNFTTTRFEASGMVTKIVTPVPEPATFVMYIFGLFGLLITTRKKWSAR